MAGTYPNPTVTALHLACGSSGTGFPCLNTANIFTVPQTISTNTTTSLTINNNHAGSFEKTIYDICLNLSANGQCVREFGQNDLPNNSMFQVWTAVSTGSTANSFSEKMNGSGTNFRTVFANNHITFNGNTDLNRILGVVGDIYATTFVDTAAYRVNGVALASTDLSDAATIARNPVSNAITSATGGTGVTSVTCATASCTNLRGTYTVVGGTATTGTIATLVWPTTTTAYVCTASQNDSGVATTYLGLGHTVATATGMDIQAGTSVIGTTFSVDYSCRP